MYQSNRLIFCVVEIDTGPPTHNMELCVVLIAKWVGEPREVIKPT